jgi:hypothetical protein
MPLSLGECPEWQRELTVNQPPHGFEGSSPSSPTSFFYRKIVWLSSSAEGGLGGHFCICFLSQQMVNKTLEGRLALATAVAADQRVAWA